MISFALMLSASLLSTPHNDGNTTIRVENGWVREAPPVARVLAGYARVCNDASTSVTLTGASSASFARVEMHATVETETAASMQRLDSVAIGAHDCVDFAPGGRHFMLLEPKDALRAGDEVKFALEFSNGEKLELVLPVRRADEMLEENGHHHHGH